MHFFVDILTIGQGKVLIWDNLVDQVFVLGALEPRTKKGFGI